MIKRALLRILVVILLGLGAAGQGKGESPPAQGSGQVPLRVGIFNNYPIVYEKGGLPTGFHLEILKKVAKEEGWALDYQFSDSLKNVIQGLETGALDLGLGLEPTEGRRQFLDFTTEKNAMVTGRVFVKLERGDIHSMKTLEGKTVAFINEGIGSNALVETSDKLGIHPIFKWVNSYDELAEALATGAVDAGLFNELQGKQYGQLYRIKPTPIEFKPTEVQFAVPKGKNSFLIATLDRYMHTGKLTTDSAYHAIERKFLQGPATDASKITNRQIIFAVSLCLLLITLGIMVGNFLSDEAATSHLRVTQHYIRNIVVFVLVMGAALWVLDSVIAWSAFNADLKMSLGEWLITNVPRENLYMRMMLFLVCCIFGIYIAKYLNKYDQLLGILMMNIKRFEQLTDNARDMIYRMSLPSGKFEFVSKASSNIFGYPPDEFYRRPLLIKDMVHKDWRQYFAEQWDGLLAGKVPPWYEYQIVTREGEVRWINQRNTLYFNEAGTPCAIEGIITDVTEQRARVLQSCQTA